MPTYAEDVPVGTELVWDRAPWVVGPGAARPPYQAPGKIGVVCALPKEKGGGAWVSFMYKDAFGEVAFTPKLEVVLAQHAQQRATTLTMQPVAE